MTLPDGYDPLTENPRLPDTINAPKVSVFRELWVLSVGVIAGFLMVMVVVWQSMGWLAQFVPMQWETRLVQPIAQSVQTGSAQQQQLQRRVNQLLLLMEAPELSVQVHLLDSADVNAFATLGGQMMVTQGLLDALNTDVGLDFVLLHELAHLHNRDPIRAAASQWGVRLLMALATGQGDLPAPTGWLQSTEQLMSLHYSRIQETRADEQAIAVLKQKYSNLDGFDELFVTLLDREGPDRLPVVLSTHPHTQVRVERLRSQVGESGRE